MQSDFSPETLRIFDCHGHAGPYRRFSSAFDGSIESMIELMDRSGIERLIFSSMMSLNHDVEAGNREMYEAVTSHPGRLYGYVVVRPDAPEREQLDELEKYRGRPGILGVKIHPDMHSSRPADPGYDPVYHWCAEYGYPLLSHTWGEANIDDFRAVTGRVPGLEVLLGHSGGPTRRPLERACALATERKGVYLDITMSRSIPGLIEWMLRRAPAQKILFGSDIPFIDPRPSVGLVLHERIDDATREAVFRTNSERLFGRLL
jgi:uncharacterized protein